MSTRTLVVRFTIEQLDSFRQMAVFATGSQMEIYVTRLGQAQSALEELKQLELIAVQSARQLAFHTELVEKLQAAESSKAKYCELVVPELTYAFMATIASLKSLDPDSPNIQRRCVDMGTSLSMYRQRIEGIRKAIEEAEPLEDAEPITMKSAPGYVH